MERLQYASGSDNRRVNEILLRVGWLALATGLTNSTCPISHPCRTANTH